MAMMPGEQPSDMGTLGAWARALDLEEARLMAYRYRRLYEAACQDMAHLNEWARQRGIDLPPHEVMGT